VKCFTAGTPVVLATNELESIEDVEVGDRVRQLAGATCSVEPFADAPETCRVVTLEFQDPYGYEDTLVVELMRSTDWLAANGAVERGAIHLAFEELGVDAPGRVVEIDACPRFEPRPRRRLPGHGHVRAPQSRHRGADVR
jgi:hypothetical protein